MRSWAWKIFFKSRVCVCLLFLLWGAAGGLLAFLTAMGAEGFLLLHTLARGGFFFCLGWVCLTFYYASHAGNSGLREALDAAGGNRSYEKEALPVLGILFFLWNLLLCGLLAAASSVNDATGYFLSWFWLPYLCNILLPGLICLMLTYLAASGKRLHPGLTAVIAFLFLISPMAENFVWSRKPAVPVDAVWNALRWPFTILYQNGDWAGNVQAGLQTEPARISVLLFWLFFCGAFLLWRNGKRKIRIAALPAGAVALLFLIYSCQPASLFRINRRWDGIHKIAWDLEQAPEAGTLRKVEDPGFTVDAYGLRLVFGRELQVEGELTLSAEEPRQEFLFTLDDGYRVKEARAAGGEAEVEMRREGNLLWILTDRAVGELKLFLCYEGHHELCYAYAGAAMLPGWLPWYPMAGERQTAIEYPGNGSEYNPYNSVPEADIRLASNMPLITNLEELGSGCYGGRADSITVLAGALVPAEDEVVLDYLPLGLVQSPEKFAQEQKEDYREALEDLERYGIDTSSLKNKKLLFLSEDIGRMDGMERVYLFRDYILAAPGYISADSLYSRMVRGDTENQRIRENSVILGKLQNLLTGNWKSPEEVRQSLERERSFRLLPEAGEDREGEILDRLASCGEKLDGERLFSFLADFGLHPEKYGGDEGFLQALEEAAARRK